MSRAEKARGGQGLLRLLSLLARPVRTAQGRDGVVLQPYRGYGSDRELFLIGRVFRQHQPTSEGSGLQRHLRDVARRITRRAVSGARVAARFGDSREIAETDADGYFRIHLALAEPLESTATWHDVTLELQAEPPIAATGQVFIPPSQSRLVVISDIDDTVVETGVANVFRMLWRLFVADAKSRVAFPGVAALYRGLHGGASGTEQNPLLYVSRAPWGTYDILDEVFKLHRIPVGPILFLREWGLSWSNPFPRRAADHKSRLISHMLELYCDRPFILVGDSGQHDPEVYARIVAEHPGRVLAVYIRDVSRSSARLKEIETLAATVARAGSALLLAADSVAIAAHAASIGCLTPEALTDVRDAAHREGGRRRPSVRRFRRGSAEPTAEAVEEGSLRPMIGASREGRDRPAHNVLVEPEPSRDGEGRDVLD